MAKLDIVCPGCGVKLTVDQAHLGKTGRCKQCGAKFPIRQPEYRPDVTATLPVSAGDTGMEYFEVPIQPGDGRCSDRSCPCPEPGTLLPRGTGYLYISREAVKFRQDCRTLDEFRKKMDRIQSGPTFFNFGFAPEGVAPILVCEQGAKKRNLDLAVAAADAKRWWDTGKVPLRPTPMK